MQDQRNGGPRGLVLKCDNCGSPDVAAMDIDGRPLCARHHAYYLGYLDGLRDAAASLIGDLVRSAVEGGRIHRADLRGELDDALKVGGLSVPTHNEVLSALLGMPEFERLETNGLDGGLEELRDGLQRQDEERDEGEEE